MLPYLAVAVIAGALIALQNDGDQYVTPKKKVRKKRHKGLEKKSQRPCR